MQGFKAAGFCPKFAGALQCFAMRSIWHRSCRSLHDQLCSNPLAVSTQVASSNILLMAGLMPKMPGMACIMSPSDDSNYLQDMCLEGIACMHIELKV